MFFECAGMADSGCALPGVWRTAMELISKSTEQTREYGARLAARARPGDVYVLSGGLGAGKTEFVRGFVGALDPDAPVRSPSFALVYTYATARFPVFHFDFYRLVDQSELTEIGFDEYLAQDGVCLIEWGERFADVLPEGARRVTFDDSRPDRRVIALEDGGAGGSGGENGNTQGE